MVLTRNLFAIVALFIASTTSYAGVAQMIRVQGDVRIVDKEGTSKKVSVQAEVENGDTINVTSNAKAQMRFEDGTLITLGRDTLFSVDDYLYNNRKNSKAEFKIIKGSFKFLTGSIGKIAPEHFKLKAETATMGIRGTYVAGNFKENRLGVLYLGEGNGAYVENEFGRTDLTEPGQGVFVALNEVPKKPLFWSRSQSKDLLKELSFEKDDELPKEDSSYLEKSSMKGSLSLYSFSNHRNDTDADTMGALVQIDYTTPTYYNLSADVGFIAQIPFSVMKDKSAKFFSKRLTSLYKASLSWYPSNSVVKAGRQVLQTPLSGTSLLRGRPSLELRNHWYKDKAQDDWWWTTPSAFEAISTEMYEIEDLKIVAAAAQKYKRSSLDEFKNSLPSVSDFGNIYLAGLEYRYGPTKLQIYDLYADEFVNTAYLQADMLQDYDKWGYFGAAQFIHQREVSDFSQDIRSSLWGLKAGAYYKGWQLWTAMSQTEKNKASEINSILTPFEGMNAFTNSYTLRNVLPQMSNTPLSSDGAYAADTFGHKIAVEYDGRYDKISPFSAMLSYSQFDQKSAQNKATALDLDLSYRFEKKLEGLSMSLKASQVRHSDFVRAEENVARFMTRYSF